MQLAWNELREQFASSKPLLLKTEDNHSLQVIKNFNEGSFTRDDINKDSIYVKSGYGQATLNLINQELLQKFPQKTIPPFTKPLNDSDIISYAYLFKKIEFDIKFDRQKELLFSFNGKNVPSFYASNQQQKGQVFVHHYQNEDSFMVEIKGGKKGDSLFLIKNKGLQTVEEAFQLVQ